MTDPTQNNGIDKIDECSHLDRQIHPKERRERRKSQLDNTNFGIFALADRVQKPDIFFNPPSQKKKREKKVQLPFSLSVSHKLIKTSQHSKHMKNVDHQLTNEPSIAWVDTPCKANL